MFQGGLPNAKGIFFLLFCINTPIISQEGFGIVKRVVFKLSSLKKREDHSLNICGATFSKNKCIISIGNDLGNLIDDNSNKILFPLIPGIKLN
jgi:hypothetical protein